MEGDFNHAVQNGTHIEIYELFTSKSFTWDFGSQLAMENVKQNKYDGEEYWCLRQFVKLLPPDAFIILHSHQH